MRLQLPPSAANYSHSSPVPSNRTQPGMSTNPNDHQRHPEMAISDTEAPTPPLQARPDNQDNGSPRGKSHEYASPPAVSVRSASPYEAWVLKGQHARPHVVALLAHFAYVVTMIFALTACLQQLSSYTRYQDTFWSTHSPALQTLAANKQMLGIQVDEMFDERLDGRFMETYAECLARGLSHFRGQVGLAAFRYPDIRQRAAEWSVENCKRIYFTPQTQNLSARQIVLAHLRRGLQVTEKLVVHARNHAAKLMQQYMPSLLQWYSQSGFHLPTGTTFANKRLRNSSRRTEWVLILPSGFNLTCETLYKCQLGVAPWEWDDDTLNSMPVPEPAMSGSQSTVLMAFDVVQLLEAIMTGLLLSLQVICACLYFLSEYYRPRMSVLESAIHPPNIHIVNPDLTKSKHAAMVWTVLEGCTILHATFGEVIAQNASTQGLSTGLFDFTFFILLFCIFVFDDSLSDTGSLIALIEDLLNIAGAKVEVMPPELPLIEEQVVGDDQNDANTHDSETTTENSTCQTEDLDINSSEDDDHVTDHEMDRQPGPPVEDLDVASHGTDDSDWSLLTVSDSEAPE